MKEKQRPFITAGGLEIAARDIVTSWAAPMAFDRSEALRAAGKEPAALKADLLGYGSGLLETMLCPVGTWILTANSPEMFAGALIMSYAFKMVVVVGFRQWFGEEVGLRSSPRDVELYKRSQ